MVAATLPALPETSGLGPYLQVSCFQRNSVKMETRGLHLRHKVSALERRSPRIRTTMQRKQMSALDLISGTLAIVVLATLAFFLISPLRALVLVAAGRGTGCPLAKALGTRSAMDAEDGRVNRIAKASRIIGDDATAGIDLWETPKGKYWLPKNQQNLLASL